jgi:hypothetical protein
VADQFSSLSPRDVVITIRSLARRFDEVARAADDPDLAERVDAVGPGGRSLSDVVTAAAQDLAFLGNEVDRVIDRSHPVVPRAALVASERSFDGAPHRAGLADAVEAIGVEANRVADRLDHMPASGWSREAAVAGGGRVALVDLARELARTGVGHLRAATAQLDWLRDTAPRPASEG